MTKPITLSETTLRQLEKLQSKLLMHVDGIETEIRYKNGQGLIIVRPVQTAIDGVQLVAIAQFCNARKLTYQMEVEDNTRTIVKIS